jgi:hypothetical protein
MERKHVVSLIGLALGVAGALLFGVASFGLGPKLLAIPGGVLALIALPLVLLPQAGSDDPRSARSSDPGTTWFGGGDC